MERKSRVERVQKLKVICFPNKKDKENIMRNSDFCYKDDSFVLEKYETKARNLEQNLKKYMNKCKITKRTGLSISHTQTIDYKSSQTILTELVSLFKSLFKELFTILKENKTELNKVYLEMDNMLHELFKCSGIDNVERITEGRLHEIIKNFQILIDTLKQLITEKIINEKDEDVKTGTLKIIKDVNALSLKELINSTVNSLHKIKEITALTKLSQMNLRISYHNKSKVLYMLRYNDYSLDCNKCTKRKSLRNLIQLLTNTEQRLLLKKMNMWRLNIAPRNALNNVPLIYGKICESLLTVNPWISLNNSLTDILSQYIKNIIHAELVRRKGNTMLTISKVTSEREIEETKITNTDSITFSKGEIQVGNILEHKKFNRAIDFPCLPFAMRILNMSMMCVPIKEIQGVIRVYKKSGRGVFGFIGKWIMHLIAQCIGKKFESEVNKIEALKDSKDHIKILKEDLVNKICIEQNACLSLSSFTNIDCIESVFKQFVVSLVLVADEVKLIPLADILQSHNDKTINIIKRSIRKPLESVKTVIENYTSKKLKQVLHIPVELNNKIIGVVEIESVINEKTSIKKFINDYILILIKGVAAVSLNLLENAAKYKECQMKVNKKLVKQRKSNGIYRILNIFKENQEKSLRYGFKAIYCYTYRKHIKVLCY